jgi:hypothetical protein
VAVEIGSQFEVSMPIKRRLTRDLSAQFIIYSYYQEEAADTPFAKMISLLRLGP